MFRHAGVERRDGDEDERHERHPHVRTLPAFSSAAVATARATAASSWFAVPNIGQIVEMLPVQMK